MATGAAALAAFLYSPWPHASPDSGRDASSPAPSHPAAPYFRRIVYALGLIKLNFVDPADETKLATSCAEAMGRALGLHERLVSVASGKPPLATQLDRIWLAFEEASSRQIGAPDPAGLADECMRAMVIDLDKTSAYMKQAEARGPHGGIGLELKREEEYTRIVSVVEGTPASKADLRAGDLLLSIDRVSLQGMVLADVVRLLRGQPGTQIELRLARDGAAEPILRELTRQTIRLGPSVRAVSLAGGLLYARIERFDESTVEQFVAAVLSEYERGGARIGGFVLDLRRCSGGLLLGCVTVASAFLPEKALIVETRGRTKDANRRFLSGPAYHQRGLENQLKRLPEAVRSVPLVMLVDRGSAGCAEILAAAMQDHGRAKIVGGTTFGFGRVHTMMALPGGDVLKLTTARYFRPNGRTLESNPVVPDAEAPDLGEVRELGSERDPALPVARRLIEEELRR